MYTFEVDGVTYSFNDMIDNGNKTFTLIGVKVKEFNNSPNTNSHVLHPQCKYCFCKSRVEGIIGAEKRDGEIQTPACGISGCRIDDAITGHRTHLTPHTCSPDKALMRVVEKTSKEMFLGGYVDEEYIQTICSECGVITREVEVKQK